MGGNAIKGAFTRRYEKKEFENILPVILEKAKKLFSDAKSTTYFKSKQNFGDADVLCLVDKPITINIKDWIIEEFGSKEVVQNTHVYSFEYNELQVDFILVPTSEWETTQVYYSYNDLHNLIGKISHRFGLKWGYRGLVYSYKIDGKKLGDITITKDYKKALSFLGFDVERYDKGFDSLQEIFDYVVSSKYFIPRVFDFDTLNRINRERDQKRPTYKSFVDFIQPLKENNDSYYYFYKDKKVYLGLIDFHFPGFLKEYRNLEKKEERKRKVHSLYNGNLLMEKFKISGKELGLAMNKFKKEFESLEKMEDWILENDTETILEIFYNKVF